MARKLEDIILHIRMCIENESVSTTLIQTEDLTVLCDAAERMEIERSRADDNSLSCQEFKAALQHILDRSSDHSARSIAEKAIKMPWLVSALMIVADTAATST